MGEGEERTREGGRERAREGKWERRGRGGRRKEEWMERTEKGEDQRGVN